MKNIKLLLATTAMLSMGTIATNATMTSETLSPTIEAEVILYNPITVASTGSIHFGRLAFEKGKSLKLNADGSIDTNISNAKRLTDDTGHPGAVMLSGGFWSLGAYEESERIAALPEAQQEAQYELVAADVTSYITLTIPNITLYEGGDTSKQVCGTVSDFSYIGDISSYERGNIGLKIGGTLTMTDSNTFTIPTNKGLRCSGSTVATLVLSE